MLSVDGEDCMYSDPLMAFGRCFRIFDVHVALSRDDWVLFRLFAPRLNTACGAPRGRRFSPLWNWA